MIGGVQEQVTSGRRSLLETAALLAFLVVCASVTWAVVFDTRVSRSQAQNRPTVPARRPEPPLPNDPLPLEGAMTKGSPSAQVVLIEYSDFQCPYCGRFARDTLPALEAKYVRTGQVLIAFRHLPLPIHSSAQKAAEAAECAGAQGRFWDMHDQIFLDPRQIAEDNLRARAQKLGLNMKAFDSCLAGKMAEKVRADADFARTLKISGTPTFFIGNLQADGKVKARQRMSGAQSIAAFETALDRLLGDASSSPKANGVGTR